MYSYFTNEIRSIKCSFLTKLPPPPHVLSNLLIYLILFSSFFLTANAKTVNRQAYKVCKTNEEAYWNGSSAQCCDTSQGKYKLVKNYTNGIGENGYACCEIKKDEVINYNDERTKQTIAQTGYQIIGAINGSCCGGWTQKTHDQADLTYYGEWKTTVALTETHDFSINQNGGVYYCAEDYMITRDESDPLLLTAGYGAGYPSSSKFCTYFNYQPESCRCRDSGDPKNGSSCAP